MTAAITLGYFAGYSSLADGSCRLKVDIPKEHAREALDVLADAIGQQVSVARLQAAGEASPPAASTGEASPPVEGASRPPDSIPAKRGERPRTPWDDLPRSIRAGMRCDEKPFNAFLAARWPTRMAVYDGDAAQFVRWHCDVKSRAELLEGTLAAKRWDKLDAEYRAWAGRLTEQRG